MKKLPTQSNQDPSSPINSEVNDFRIFMEKIISWASIIESSEDAIITKTLDGIITSWNKGAEKIFGFSASEAIGKSITIIIPKDLQKEEVAIIKKLKRGIQIEHSESVRLRKDGNKINVSLSISPIKDSGGAIIGAAKIVRDITHYKQMEQNLKFLSEASKILSSSLDYQTTLNSVAQLAVPDIADWCAVHLVEDGQAKQVALTHKDPQKIKWAMQINKQYPQDMDAKTGVPNVLKTAKSELYPQIPDEMIVAAAKDKNHLKLIRNIGLKSAMIVPIIINNKCIGAITFVTTETMRKYNPSDLKIAEELATRAGLAINNARIYKETQRAIAMRDDFISIASHELKTPVTSLKVYTQVLKQHSQKNSQSLVAPYLDRMDAQVDKLTKLISDLLNISRFQTGKLEFEESFFDINQLINEVVDNIQASSPDSKLILQVKKVGKIYGDKDRVGQVLVNLLSNAIKYSPKVNKIIIRLLQESNKINISVQDFGIGIDKKHHEQIFERFYQVDNPQEKTYPGLGIGLYISKEIALRHGGNLRVKSSRGKGSTFTLILPKKRGKK